MTLLLTLALFGLISAALVILFARNYWAAWVCVLFANCLNYAVGSDAILLGTIHLNPLDLLYFCLIPAGVVRSRFHELRVSSLTIFTAGYVLLFAFSTARGLGSFDLATVGNEGRGLIGEVIALLYFTTIPHEPKIVKRVVLAYIVYSVILIGICAGHYAGLPIGGVVGVTNNQPIIQGDIDRGLPATAAASIELALIFAASWVVYRKHSRWLPVVVGLSTIALLVLQHRSVWAMLIVAVICAALIDRPFFRYLLRVGGAVAAIGAVVLVSYIGVRQQLTGELEQSATNTNTLEWRFESWQRSVEQDQSALSVLVGLPVGSGYLRLDTNAGGFINFPPHNEFINQYLRVGILGTILLVLFLLRPVYLYFRNPDSGRLLYPSPACWILVTLSVIVFGFPYSYNLDAIALVAMANGLMYEPQAMSSAASEATGSWVFEGAGQLE